MQQRGKVVGLDWMRGVAAIIVLAFHATAYTRLTLFSHGYLAVDAFFILSGFVISLSYEGMMKADHGASTFLTLRVIRLYPLALLGSCVGLITLYVGFAQTNHPLTVLILQALLIPQLWQNSNIFLLNPVHWSLMFEVVANVVHLIAVRSISIRKAMLLLAAGWLSIAVTSYVFGNLHVGYARANLVGGVARTLFGYTAGVLLFRLYEAGKLQRLRVPAWLVPLLPGIILLPAIPFLDGYWFDDLIVVSILPLIVAVTVTSGFPDKLTSAAKWSGLLSYPLYAIHLPLVIGGRAIIDYSGMGQMARIAAMVVLALVIVGAVLAAQFLYDEPVRRWLGKRAHAVGPRPPAATVP